MKILMFLLLSINFYSEALAHDTISHKQSQIMQNFADRILKHRAAPWGVTAISMSAQCKANKPIFVYGGFTSINNKIPIHKNSLFPVASVTKSFITIVILQLVQEYNLNLDSEETLKKYFPEYPKWGKITLRQLLNMTSGIPGTGTGESDDIFMKFTAKQYKNYISTEDILNRVYPLALHFEPGTHWEYSNTNYILLGMLIQKITNHSAIDEVQRRIINQLGLHNTYFPVNKLKEVPGINPSDIVHGYAYWPKKHPYPFIKSGQDTTNFSFSEPSYAGGIVSTPKDINTYLHALYQSNKLLNKSQLKEFMTLISKKNGKPYVAKKFPKDFGAGFGVFGYYSKAQKSIVYFYQASLDGYQFYYFYNPKTQMYLTFGINSRSDIVWKDNTMALFDAINAQCEVGPIQ